jgi:hypothetical protein
MGHGPSLVRRGSGQATSSRGIGSEIFFTSMYQKKEIWALDERFSLPVCIKKRKYSHSQCIDVSRWIVTPRLWSPGPALTSQGPGARQSKGSPACPTTVLAPCCWPPSVAATAPAAGPCPQHCMPACPTVCGCQFSLPLSSTFWGLGNRERKLGTNQIESDEQEHTKLEEYIEEDQILDGFLRNQSWSSPTLTPPKWPEIWYLTIHFSYRVLH